MGIKTGTSVRYVIPDIVGLVVGSKLDDDENVLKLVEYVDADGEVQQRYFKEDELRVEELPVDE